MKHDIEFGTSLYNHGSIAKNGLPLIGNGAYALLLSQVREGKHSFYESAKLLYSFEPKQAKLIEAIIEGRVL